MSFTVTVQPSGHSFEVKGRQSILDAGLEAGLNLEYSCVGGNCGTCRARLVSGDVEDIQFTDYRFSPVEQEQGWFLMCSHRALSDLVIEANELGEAHEVAHQQLEAKVGQTERLQDEVMMVQVRTPRTKTLQFLAGQQVDLTFDGLPPQRLPLASCPCDGMHLRFHLRRRAGDPFSDYVFNELHKGTPVEVSGPYGDFVMDDDSRRPLILVAWESGFAPVASLIDHAIQIDENRTIHLYWASAIPRGHYLSNYCRAWVDALDDFHYHSIDLAPAGERQLPELFESIARAHAPLAEWDCYAAVPAGAGLQAQSWLGSAGRFVMSAFEHP